MSGAETSYIKIRYKFTYEGNIDSEMNYGGDCAGNSDINEIFHDNLFDHVTDKAVLSGFGSDNENSGLKPCVTERKR